MEINKYQNVEINLIAPDFDNIIRPIQLDEYLHRCGKCGSRCGRNIFKHSDNDRNRFLDENSRIDIEKNDLICNTSNHTCNSDESNEWMGCIRRGNESRNNWFVILFLGADINKCFTICFVCLIISHRQPFIMQKFMTGF